MENVVRGARRAGTHYAAAEEKQKTRTDLVLILQSVIMFNKV